MMRGRMRTHAELQKNKKHEKKTISLSPTVSYGTKTDGTSTSTAHQTDHHLAPSPPLLVLCDRTRRR